MRHYLPFARDIWYAIIVPCGFIQGEQVKRAFANIVACCGSGFFALAVMTAACSGAVTPTPADIVRQLYAEPSPNPFEKIAAHASRSFAKAANREAQCENSLGTCVFDFDALRGSQCGGQVKDLRIERSAIPNGVMVRANFNLDCGYENTAPFATVVIFRFTREDGAWKIDDIGPGLKQQIESYDYAWNNHP